MKKTILTILACATLYSCTGCSDSNSSLPEPTPEVNGNYTVSDMVIYEANPRVFATENAFAAIEANLDHIKSLGTTVLWLMPIYDPGMVNTVHSPYCIKNFKALNPRYGTMDDLKNLVKATHDKGMKIILDWVANHTSWDHSWVTEHPDWYTEDRVDTEKPWQDINVLDFNNTDMQAAMIDAMKYWVTETGIDGYRCDYAEGQPESFWTKALGELRKLDEDLILLAEAGVTSIYNCGFQMLYAWNFHTKLKNYYGGKGSLEDLYAQLKDDWNGMPEGTYRLRYSTNHDQASEASPIQCYNGEKGAMSAFVIATMIDGIPLIYSTQEAAYPEKLSFFEYEVKDVKANPDFAKEMTAVIKAYKDTKDVRGGELVTYSTGKVASFARKAGNHGMLVMVNTTDEALQIKVPMDYSGKTLENVISGTSLQLTTAVSLEAYGYLILKY